MDLDVRTFGKVPQPLGAEYLRDMTPADIEVLNTEPRGTEARPLVRLRDSHHALAMALADGMSEAVAATVAGYAISRVQILRADPTFQELIEHYRTEKTRPEMQDLAARMLALGRDTVDILRERLEETPETFENSELVTIATKFADRTGFGPQAKSLNVNVHVGLAEGLAAARERRKAAEAARLAAPQVLDLEVADE